MAVPAAALPDGAVKRLQAPAEPGAIKHAVAPIRRDSLRVVPTGDEVSAAPAGEARAAAGGVKLLSPASRVAASAVLSGAEVPGAPAGESRAAAPAADGGGLKLVSPASRESLSKRLKDARFSTAAAAGEEEVGAVDNGIRHMSKSSRESLKVAARVSAASPASGDNGGGGGHRGLQTTSSCTAGSSVFVTSSEFPLMEGCLAELDLYINNEVEWVSDTGLIIAGATVEDPDSVSSTPCSFASLFQFCSSLFEMFVGSRLLCVRVCCVFRSRWCSRPRTQGIGPICNVFISGREKVPSFGPHPSVKKGRGRFASMRGIPLMVMVQWCVDGLHHTLPSRLAGVVPTALSVPFLHLHVGVDRIALSPPLRVLLHELFDLRSQCCALPRLSPCDVRC